MSNLGFIIKTILFSYISVFFIFLGIINIENMQKWIKIFIFLINLLIVFVFSIFNNYFLQLEKWFRDYQDWKIKKFDNLDLKEIIIFNPNQMKKKKPKFKKEVYFSFTIFWFYLFSLLLSSGFLIIIFLT